MPIFRAARLGFADDGCDHGLDGRVALVEHVRDEGRVAIDAEDQLGEVVRADREAVKDLGEVVEPG